MDNSVIGQFWGKKGLVMEYTGTIVVGMVADVLASNESGCGSWLAMG